nr:hypothetical protein CFP56_20548 [Quercus suber]
MWTSEECDVQNARESAQYGSVGSLPSSFSAVRVPHTWRMHDERETTFTVLTLLSEYIVAFDLDTFVVLLASLESVDSDLRRPLLVLLLCSALEPTAYTFVDSIINPKPRPLFVNVFVAIAKRASLVELGSAALSLVRRWNKAAPDKGCGKQTPASLLPLRATVPFITCAALANAGLRLCTYYLDTTLSRDWFDRSATQWSLFALLCLSAFFAAKAGNLMAARYVAPLHWSTDFPKRSHHAEGAVIFLINLWRAVLRWVFFTPQQRVFADFAVCRQGAALCILLGPSRPDDNTNLIAAAFIRLLVIYTTVIYTFGMVVYVVAFTMWIRNRWFSRGRPEQTTEDAEMEEQEHTPQLDTSDEKLLEATVEAARKEIILLFSLSRQSNLSKRTGRNLQVSRTMRNEESWPRQAVWSIREPRMFWTISTFTELMTILSVLFSCAKHTLDSWRLIMYWDAIEGMVNLRCLRYMSGGEEKRGGKLPNSVGKVSGMDTLMMGALLLAFEPILLVGRKKRGDVSLSWHHDCTHHDNDEHDDDDREKEEEEPQASESPPTHNEREGARSPWADQQPDSNLLQPIPTATDDAVLLLAEAHGIRLRRFNHRPLRSCRSRCEHEPGQIEIRGVVARTVVVQSSSG